MDDLIGTVTEKAGISETQAKMAIGAVIGQLEGKLPGPVVAQIKKALGLDAGGMLGSVMGDAQEGKLGGIADMAKGAMGGGGDAAGGLADAAKGLLGN